MTGATRKRNVYRKAKNRRRLDWRKLARRLIWLTAFAVMAGAVAWAVTTPRLAVKRIEVRGNRIAPTTTFQRLAEGAVGRNIVTINTRAIRRAMLRRPEVLDVKMYRKPPHALVVKIRERTQFAVVTTGAGFYEIDKDGLVFHKVNSPTPSLTLIALEAPIPLRLGNRPRSPHLAAAVKCVKLCNERGCRISKMSVDRAGNVCLNMGSSFYVKLGRAEQVAQKLEIVETALRARPEIAKEALYIDVSCPPRPAWKPRGG